jgi:DNA topoisomerase-1
VDDALNDRQFSHVEREIGVDPETGLKVIAKFGQYGPYVQKGDDANRQYASLSKGQLIENLTLEEALRLFQLPRTVGEYEGVSIVATKGRFGPYLRYGDKNVSLPRGVDPMKVTVDQCVKLIEEAKHKDDAVAEIKRFETMDITIINGRYGPYLKHDGKNYRIPKDVSAESLTEEQCKEIIEGGSPTVRRGRRFKKK